MTTEYASLARVAGRRLDREDRVPGLGEHPDQQGQSLGGAGDDDEVVRLHHRRADPFQIVRELLTEGQRARWSDVPQLLVGQQAQHVAGCSQPHGTRERGQVGQPRAQIDVVRRCFAGWG